MKRYNLLPFKFLSIAVLLCSFNFSCSKDVDGDHPCGPHYTEEVSYTIVNDEEVFVAGYDAGTDQHINYGGYIRIPDKTEINGKTYTVTGIESEAFKNCEKIYSISLPSTLKIIEEEAFSGCSTITSINLPASVEYIAQEEGKGVFYNCFSLERIEVAQSNPYYSSYNGILYDKDKVMVIAFPAGQSSSNSMAASTEGIAHNAFSGCRVQNLSLPHSLRIIGDYAFRDCFYINNVSIPEDVNIIGEGCFSGCVNLKDITLPENLFLIGSLVFNDCNSLEIVQCIGSTPPEVMTTEDGECELVSHWDNQNEVVLMVNTQYLDNYLNNDSVFTKFFSRIVSRY